MRRLIICFLAALLLISAAPAAAAADTAVLSGGTNYGAAVSALLPDAALCMDTTDGLFPALRDGKAAEVFDTQALPALECGAADYWYPQYLATVVIAVDRSRTGARITGWGDIAGSGETVGITDEEPELSLLLAGMSCGLDGTDYKSYKSAAAVLRTLRTEGRLEVGGGWAPVVICFDSEAAEMIRAGGNIEVIVPKEGTLTFEKGLLSKNPLRFSGSTEDAVLAAGLRSLNGKGGCAGDYSPARVLSDYGRLITIGETATATMRRDILGTHIFRADGVENQIAALAFIVITVAWITTVIRRAMRRQVRWAAIAIGTLLLGWTLVRIVKWQLVSSEAAGHILWYCYYFFLLALPLVLLWLTWAVDRPDTPRLPAGMLVCVGANAALLLLILTNDAHQLAFSFRPDGDYGYGPVYYAAAAVILLETALAVGELLYKSRKSPRKAGMLLPVLLPVLAVIYVVCYVMRIKFAVRSDLTLVFCLFMLLFCEASLSTGLVPVNSRYQALFRSSPLDMQILDGEGRIVLAADGAVPVSREDWLALRDGGSPLKQAGGKLLFGSFVTGGMAIWQEDVGELDHLQDELRRTADELRTVNAVIEREKANGEARIKSETASALLHTLGTGMNRRLAEMQERIRVLPETDWEKDIPSVTLLLCYIKRRCNLFFLEREGRTMAADELMVYMDELSEFAQYAGVRVLTGASAGNGISVPQAVMCYDLMYAAIEWETERGGTLIEKLEESDGRPELLLTLPGEDGAFHAPAELERAVAAAGGKLEVKDLDELVGVRLSFGGEGGND